MTVRSGTGVSLKGPFDEMMPNAILFLAENEGPLFTKNSRSLELLQLSRNLSKSDYRAD